MPTVGSGVCEIRVRDQAGAFRVIYVTKFEDAVYVLHAFQKKSRKTSPSDLELATALPGRTRSRERYEPWLRE
jgi:phage-related protein